MLPSWFAVPLADIDVPTCISSSEPSAFLEIFVSEERNIIFDYVDQNIDTINDYIDLD